MIDSSIIEGFRSDNEMFFKNFYKTYRQEFVKFLTKKGISTADAIEIFHESILVMRKKAFNYELQEIQVSFKTYFFAIGKNKAYDLLNRENKSIVFITDNLPATNDGATDEECNDALIEKIKKNLLSMGSACKKLLTSFYLQGLTIKELVITGGYENENTVRAQKSRCLKKLKEMINKDIHG
ncbi:RNA polymerase sigma factor [Mongoliitalea lutea]|uniref:RNA polymerase sigma factor, sigma-70 family n=1 Tax=Mongoliitalea lutea TaxID=849756 RepID=A0A8J3G3Z9_9BACT|nr:sigma-70 family RNA polymerase sigma factor [Mongoliitalea lutea]GHB25625.1 hypothetical protein GCM10008106_03000 [Mongoliitalea lutea]